MVVEMCHWRRKFGFSVVSTCRLFWTIARMELADELDDNDGKRKTNKQKMIREILKWQRRRQQLNANGTWMLCSREMKILTQRKHENYLNKGKRTVENMLHCHAIHISYIYSIQYVIENNMYVYPIWKLDMDRPKIDLSFCHLQYTSLFFFSNTHYWVFLYAVMVTTAKPSTATATATTHISPFSTFPNKCDIKHFPGPANRYTLFVYQICPLNESTESIEQCVNISSILNISSSLFVWCITFVQTQCSFGIPRNPNKN